MRGLTWFAVCVALVMGAVSVGGLLAFGAHLVILMQRVAVLESEVKTLRASYLSTIDTDSQIIEVLDILTENYKKPTAGN